MSDLRAVAAAYGFAIELLDSGDWGRATLIAEYDRGGPTIRINAPPITARCADDTRRAIDLAIAHELYHHREAVGELTACRETERARARADAYAAALLEAADPVRSGITGAVFDDGRHRDEAGRWWGPAGWAGHHVDEGPGSSRCADACAAAFASALASRGFRRSGVEAAVAAFRDTTTPFDGAGPPRWAGGRFRFVHDLPIALAAPPARPAVLLLSGTVSAAYGDEAAWAAASGGWVTSSATREARLQSRSDALAAAMRATIAASAAR